MAQRADVERGREIIQRWCVLAEQRLEHLTELFETGRWRRYHTESALLENIQEAKTAVETWRMLASREASLDNSAIDLSWLSSPRPLPPRRNPLSGYYVPPPPPPRRAGLPPRHTPLAPEISLNPSELQQRYPLLRNAV